MKRINYKKYSSIWPIVKRHWRTTWPYLNVRKAGNILVSKMSAIAGGEKLNSYPFFIKIEPTNRCMLRCSCCLHSAARNEPLENIELGDMDFTLFKKIIDQLAPYLLKVSLYSEGEPLIYRRIADMVKYLSDNNIASVISSNLNFLPPALAKELVKSRLTHLIVSLDGYDQESYIKYRDGGNFDHVITNIKIIQAEKERQASRLPYLEIQTLDLPYFGREDLGKVGSLARELGADFFLVKEDISSYYGKPRPKAKKCFWLYASPQFKWNGFVQPCCYYYGDKCADFGDAKIDAVIDIWNNEKYKSARRFFRSGKMGRQIISCYNCNFFKKGSN